MTTQTDFSQREIEIMSKAWACMTETPKVDYVKLAAACGMSNTRSASNAWANIRKKMLALNPPSASASDAVATGPKRNSPSKRAKDAAHGGDGVDAEESPTKKIRGEKKKGKGADTVVKKEEGEEEAGGTEFE